MSEELLQLAISVAWKLAWTGSRQSIKHPLLCLKGVFVCSVSDLCRRCVEMNPCGSLLIGCRYSLLLVWAVTGVPSDREKRYKGVSAWPCRKAAQTDKKRQMNSLITEVINHCLDVGTNPVITAGINVVALRHLYSWDQYWYTDVWGVCVFQGFFLKRGLAKIGSNNK